VRGFGVRIAVTPDKASDASKCVVLGVGKSEDVTLTKKKAYCRHSSLR
jgi:hypothetical protein